MDTLTEEFIEKTWEKVDGLTDDQAHKEMMAMGKQQPELLAFLMAYTDDYRQEVKELAIYIAFVVYKMFHDFRGRIAKISSRVIMTRYDENVRLLEKIEGTYEKSIRRVAGIEVSRQPYVMQYVLEALTEDAEADGIELTEKEIGSLFVLLKTEIEVLDQICTRSGSGA